MYTNPYELVYTLNSNDIDKLQQLRVALEGSGWNAYNDRIIPECICLEDMRERHTYEVRFFSDGDYVAMILLTEACDIPTVSIEEMIAAPDLFLLAAQCH